MEEAGGRGGREEGRGGPVLSGQESDERSQTGGLAGVCALAGPRLTECHRGRGEPDEEDVGDLSYST